MPARETRHINTKMICRLFEHFRQWNAGKPPGRWNLIVVLGRLDQVLDARNEFLTAEQPPVDRGGKRVLGRIVETGLDEPSIGCLRVLEMWCQKLYRMTFPR